MPGSIPHLVPVVSMHYCSRPLAVFGESKNTIITGIVLQLRLILGSYALECVAPPFKNRPSRNGIF